MLQYRVFPAVVSETLDSGGGIFILYPVLNVQLTPVVTANRHFHVTAFSLRCYPKHSIGMFCFLRMMRVESQHELILLC